MVLKSGSPGRASYSPAEGVEVYGKISPGYESILIPDACRYVAGLAREFSGRRKELLRKRAERQQEFDAGQLPDFLPGTKYIRDGAWTVAPLPKDLEDRRVEITGPVGRKMIIKALNSGANAFMADFEDSHSPTWKNNIEGQINLLDAVNRTITYTSPEQIYKLNENIAVLMVRPRGLHLPENHFVVDGEPISASFFDLGLYFYNNARNLCEQGKAPYFYFPKLESHLEARLVNDVVAYSQEKWGIQKGTTKISVLIETLPAVFEMDEILHELKDHSAGLNFGRWDYIFSFIKKLAERGEYVLPDRASLQVGKTEFLTAGAQLLVQTCHKRGAHGMGGMSAYIPIKTNPKATENALDEVRKDKRWEALAGCDGAWVAHPDLVGPVREEFDNYIKGPNQIHVKGGRSITASDLLKPPSGEITEQGMRTNIRVPIQYLESWLRGVGCVPLNNLMEDAATAEISRSQIWQWLRHRATLNDGRVITDKLYREIEAEELTAIERQVGKDNFAQGRYREASELFRGAATGKEFVEFLTIPAYERLVGGGVV